VLQYIKRLIFKTIMISSIICNIPFQDTLNWNILQDDDIWIGYIEQDYPWCKSSILLNYSIDEILLIVEDVDNYYRYFDTVFSSTKDQNNVVHIILNMPIPFADRDYVVKYNKITEGNTIIFRFQSNEKFLKPVLENYVRLPNAAGEWRLESLGEKITKVTYIWNGELSGNFPNWAYSRAWTKQGNEVLGNLKKILESKGVSK
tara:strand:- start:681 stop:1289 length:609 start_codon:yes stop_codon:yes gene_type:complete